MERKIYSLFLMVSVLLGAGNVYAEEQTEVEDGLNVGAPNLNLEEGSLAHWEQYIGGYYLDETDSTYKYQEWVEVEETDRITLVNGNSDSQDPIIGCWDFLTNPDGKTTVRVGDYKYRNVSLRKVADAERLVYRFKVTENTPLLTYRYAVVVHEPELTHTQGGLFADVSMAEHTKEQRPNFMFTVSYLNADGTYDPLPSGEFSAIDSEFELVADQEEQTCRRSMANRVDEYAFHRWTYGNIDLTDHIGQEVRIEIITHGCLRGENQGEDVVVTAGSHNAYGYFWAEAKKPELKVNDCAGQNAEIIAPSGFSSYEWSRSDNVAVAVDPENPAVAIVPNDLKDTSVAFSCSMADESGLEVMTLTTRLPASEISLDFDYESDCDGMVQFTNVEAQTSGDEVVAYTWDFGNEKTSNVMTPSMVYAQPGNYQVVLTAKTAKGCEVSFSKIVDVRYFPSLRIVGPDSVCVGDTAHLELIGAPENCSIVWDNGAGTPSLNVSIPVEGPVSYQASMTDEYQCTYNASITMEVVNCESVGTKDNGADDGCKVWTSALTIYVQGAKDVVEVYDLGGRLVERKPAGDDTLKFIMPQAGAYIVKVGRQSVKVDL